jgi:SAM-dependent methyltransferase
MDERDFEVLRADELGDEEAEDAKRYWAGRGVHGFYRHESHWATYMAEQVLAFAPRRVLEFGSNVGRNLEAIRARDDRVAVSGIDINEDAVVHGRKRGLDLRVGDERALAALPDDAFDVVFTVSVLDHVPNPAPILAHLVRVARSAVLLLEPELGEEGRILTNVNSRTRQPNETVPYSYSWDYERLLDPYRASMEITRQHYPLVGTNLGDHYHVFRLVHRRGHVRWYGSAERTIEVLEQRVVKLTDDRTRLRGRVAEQRARVERLQGQIAAMRARRWWRLGEALTAVRKNPRALASLPAAVWRILRGAPPG